MPDDSKPVHTALPLIVPNPDPSAITVDMIRRELSNLEENFIVRLNAIDKATALFEANLTRVPTEVDKQIDHLLRFHDQKFDVQNEKFSSIQTQFRERDVRATASEDAAKVAVNAALQAQKEAAASQNYSNAAAITKSEAATVKQIDGILALLQSNGSALSDKISTINGRLDRGEGNIFGNKESIATSHSSNAQLIAIVAVVVSVIMGAFSLFGGNHSTPAPAATYYPPLYAQPQPQVNAVPIVPAPVPTR